MLNTKAVELKTWIQNHKRECVAGGALALLLVVGGAGVAVMQHQAQPGATKNGAEKLVKSTSAEKTLELGKVAQNAVGANGVADSQATSGASSESNSGGSSESSSGGVDTSSKNSSAGQPPSSTTQKSSSSSSAGAGQTPTNSAITQAKEKPKAKPKRWVVDKPAWDETVVVEKAWDEPIYERKRFYKTSDGKVFPTVEECIAYEEKVILETGKTVSNSSIYKKVQVGTKHHPAQTKVVHHPEQGHWE